MKAYCDPEAREQIGASVEFWGQTTLALICTTYQLSDLGQAS